MTHGELKRKVLALIEELNEESPMLTDDPDIAKKYNEVANQILCELARIKKIPKFAEIEVSKGDRLTLEDIGDACDGQVYQVALFRGVRADSRAGGTVYLIQEDGVAEMDCYVYPTRLTEKTGDKFQLELSQDALEVAPYGIAADLLKSDVSAQYGSVYASRYETMLERLDPRYSLPHITFEGGAEI